MTTFQIRNTFKFDSRQSIVFAGDIIQGTIENGQVIKLDSTDNHPEFRFKISSVEMIDIIIGKSSMIGLMVKVDNQEELKKIMDFGIKDETCQIVSEP
jgi:hypothetical protein